MSKHLIIDFETMGKDSATCAIIDCSVMVFDADKMISSNPYSMDSINLTRKFKLSIKDQVTNYGWEIDKSTLSFWEEQPANIRANITPRKTDLTVKDFVNQFHEFLIDSPKIDYWWSRSNTFDPIILTRIFKAENKLLHLEEYLKYWRVRDMRTFIDAKLNFPKKNGFIPIDDEDTWNKTFLEHDSSWDVLADVLRMQKIIRIENDSEG